MSTIHLKFSIDYRQVNYKASRAPTIATPPRATLPVITGIAALVEVSSDEPVSEEVDEAESVADVAKVVVVWPAELVVGLLFASEDDAEETKLE